MSGMRILLSGDRQHADLDVFPCGIIPLLQCDQWQFPLPTSMQEVPITRCPVDPTAVLPEDVEVVRFAEHICAAGASLQSSSAICE